MTLSKILDNALGWHECFRRLGFSCEELTLATVPIGDVMEIQSAIKHGEDRFGFFCGRIDGVTLEQISEAWRMKVQWWNDPETSQEDSDAIWVPWLAARDTVALMTKLVELGIYGHEQVLRSAAEGGRIEAKA